MSSLFALRALLFAGECLAASALLLSLAWLGSKFLRQASLRHFLWLTAFGTLLVLPVVALIVPPQVVVERAAAVRPAIPLHVGASERISDAAAHDAPAPVPTTRASFALPKFDVGNGALVLFLLWLAGICWATLRLVAGAFCLRELRRRSRPHGFAPGDLPQLPSPHRECELRLSIAQDGPLTWGFLSPVILLPSDAARWSRERLHAVLLHELAHVRRRDSLTQALSLAVGALYWPNPMVWLGMRALRREAEIAADDAVLASGMRPSAYAGELLQIASTFRVRRGGLSSVAMASRSSLEERVKSVLAPNQLRTGVTSMDALKIACIGIAATALLALLRPDVVEAQATPPAPPAATVVQAELPPPPAPPAPAAVPAPPPVPAVAAEPPLPPDDAMQADDDEAAVEAVSPKRAHSHRHAVHVVRMENGKVIEDSYRDADSAFDRAELDRAMAEARRAQAELKRLKPTIDRAIAQARIGEHIAEAMARAQPAIDAKVRAALAKAQPEIDRAIADAHISERVARAIREAQPRIDAAMVRIQKSVDKHHNVVIRSEANDGDADMDSDQDEDSGNEADDDSGASSSGH